MSQSFYVQSFKGKRSITSSLFHLLSPIATELSPAQILFARQLKDGLPCDPLQLEMNPNWIQTIEERESKLIKRYLKSGQLWARESKLKSDLTVGQSVLVQCQTGANKGRWLQSGVILDNVGHQSYNVKMDGSGRVSKRRRQYLKPKMNQAHLSSSQDVDSVKRIYNLRHKMS